MLSLTLLEEGSRLRSSSAVLKPAGSLGSCFRGKLFVYGNDGQNKRACNDHEQYGGGDGHKDEDALYAPIDHIANHRDNERAEAQHRETFDAEKSDLCQQGYRAASAVTRDRPGSACLERGRDFF